MMKTPTASRTRAGAPFWFVDHGDARRQGDARCRSVPTLPLAPEFLPWLMLNWPTRALRTRSPSSRGTSFPITGDSRSVWSGVRARGCGMRKGIATSTSSQAGAATCWAIARPGSSTRFATRSGSSSTCPIPGTWNLRERLPRRFLSGLLVLISIPANVSSATAAPRPTRRRSSWRGLMGMPMADTRLSRWKEASTAGLSPP